MQINVVMTEMVAKRYAEDRREFIVEIKAGSTMDKLITKLGIPDSERSYIMHTVNGNFCDKDKELKDGDNVKILPVIGGG